MGIQTKQSLHASTHACVCEAFVRTQPVFMRTTCSRPEVRCKNGKPILGGAPCVSRDRTHRDLLQSTCGLLDIIYCRDVICAYSYHPGDDVWAFPFGHQLAYLIASAVHLSAMSPGPRGCSLTFLLYEVMTPSHIASLLLWPAVCLLREDRRILCVPPGLALLGHIGNAM